MSRRLITGDFGERREPEWAPLERLTTEDIAADFMWMFEIALADGMRLQAYKHWLTRRYLHLGPGAEAFVFRAPESYERVCADCLLELALMHPGPGIEREAALLRQMMRRCGWDRALSGHRHAP